MKTLIPAILTWAMALSGTSFAARPMQPQQVAPKTAEAGENFTAEVLTITFDVVSQLSMRDDRGRIWSIEARGNNLLRMGFTRDILRPGLLVAAEVTLKDGLSCTEVCRGTLSSMRPIQALRIRDARLEPATLRCTWPQNDPDPPVPVPFKQRAVSVSPAAGSDPAFRFVVRWALEVESEDPRFAEVVSVWDGGALTRKGAYLRWDGAGMFSPSDVPFSEFQLQAVGSNCRRVSEAPPDKVPQFPGYRFVQSAAVPGSAMAPQFPDETPERVGAWVSTSGPRQTLLARFDPTTASRGPPPATVIARVPVEVRALSVMGFCAIDYCREGIGGLMLAAAADPNGPVTLISLLRDQRPHTS